MADKVKVIIGGENPQEIEVDIEVIRMGLQKQIYLLERKKYPIPNTDPVDLARIASLDETLGIMSNL